jgi:LPS-assembly protein
MNLGFIRKDDIYDDRDLVDQTSTGVDTSSVTIPPFEKQDRWYINLRHSGDWTGRLKTSGIYSAVSDIDYLQDIGGDVGSTTIDQFVGPIDQSLANRVSAALDRRGEITWRGDGWNTSMLIQGFQNLDPLGQEQYEMLPQLTTDISQEIGPLEIVGDVEYTLFDKDNDSISGPLAIVGERAVAEIEVSLRKSTIWGFVEPSVGVIHRKYNLNDVPGTARVNPEESTARFSLDAGLFFDRFFTASSRELQQTLEPRLFYLYSEEDDQNDLPQFDATQLTPGFAQLFRDNRFNGKDRIGDARQLSLGITSRFLDQQTGAQFFEVSVGQIYYFKDRAVIFQPTPAEDPLARESPLFAEARLSLNNGLNVAGTFEWEPDVGRTNRSTIAVKYKSGDRKILNLNYTYNNPMVQPASLATSSEETDLNFIWPAYRNWSAIGRWNFSWDRHQTIESFYGVEYNDCCWKTRIVIRRFLKEPRNITLLIDDPTAPGGFVTETQTITPPDMGIFVEFQMKGLATLGRRLNLLLEQAIPGYEAREEIVGQ